jgi:outer membrane protein assembly factor BamB
MSRMVAKPLALAAGLPVAVAVYQGLLMLRGPGELFEDDDPLPPAQAAEFADPAALSAWPHAGDWPMFQRDPAHTGRSPADFPSADLVPAWPQPFVGDPNHVWQVEKGASVWSPPVIGRIPQPDGKVRAMLFVGCYDRALYALDAATGKAVWRKTFTHGAVYASPALAMVGGRAMVFAAGTDRVVYAFDAVTGDQLWAFETREWTQSTTPAVMSSPTPIRLFGRVLLVCGVWNSDRSGTENAQDGELIAFDAATGKVEWRVRLGTSPATSPAVGRVRGETVVFAACEDGTLRALDARNGRTLWQRTLHQELRGSPTLALADDGVPVVLLGTKFHSIYGLGAVAGARLWLHQTGYWVYATPALAEVGGKTRAFVGSYDQHLYSLDVAARGRLKANLWRYGADNQFRTSAATAKAAGRPAVFAVSWDDTLHLISADRGERLWTRTAGPLLFSHEFEGDALWAGPAVADLPGAGPHVFFPAHDGKLYAFRAADAAGR